MLLRSTQFNFASSAVGGGTNHRPPNSAPPPRITTPIPPRISDTTRKVNPNWTASEFCLDLVRTRDWDSYICTAHLPKATRDAVAALRAFNIETATIKDITRNEDIRKMRLRWWRDAIDGLYRGAALEYPVTVALRDAIEKYKLTKGWFLRILDAREADMLDKPFRSVLDLEQYSENTNASLFYLTLEACGVRHLQADHVASHVGKSLGLITAIRATPHLSSQRRCTLPLSLLVKHNLSQEDLYTQKEKPALKEVVFDLASTANVHLEHARGLRKEVPKAALPALLHAVVCDRLLKRLQRVHFDVYHPAFGQRDLWLHLSIWSHYIRGTY